MFLAQRCIAEIIKVTVAEIICYQKVPDVTVLPVENWEDSCKIGPSSATFTYRLKILRIGISSSITHNNRFHILFVNKSLNFALEVSGIQFDLYIIRLLHFSSKLRNFFKFPILYKVNVFDFLKSIFGFIYRVHV